MDRQAHLIFEGRVQGVFFRANTRRIAAELGLKGWVSNLDDGSVEAVVEGSQGAIRELIGRLRTEVPGAHVNAVRESWRAADGRFASFEIRR